MTGPARVLATASLALACSTTAESPSLDGGSGEVTLDVGEQRWVDGERLSIFLHDIEPAQRLVTIYLQPRDDEQRTFSLDLGETGNTIVTLEPWTVRLVEIVDPDTATFTVSRGAGAP